MFNYDKTLKQLRDFKKVNPKKRRKVIANLFYDESFIEWLFQPKKVANLTEMVSAMYEEFTKPNVMITMIDVIKDEGYHEFNNSHATFLMSVANIAIQANNEALEKVSKEKKEGKISSRDAKRVAQRVDECNHIIAKLIKVSRKIVKRRASIISKDARLPRYVVISALTSVPEYKYIDKFKIGFYLNNMLNSIYSEVEENGDFEHDVRWRVFFKELFGKDNVIEVATFITLEGVHRVDKYQNSDDVKDCWDSLTLFALRELNGCTEQIRTQMIELYLKRIAKMFSNKSYDLRVDLLDLDEDTFPNLAKTVMKYADKIKGIISPKND